MGVGVREIGVMDITNQEFSTLSIDTIGNSFRKRLFWGSVVVGRHIYFAPYDSNMIYVLDIDKQKFHAIDIENYVSGRSKFRGVVHIDEKIYFIPFNANVIGVLDLKSYKFSTLSLDKQEG